MNAWLTIPPSRFEELVYHLLRKEGFHNVSWFGVTGADGSRDLICERTELFGTRVLTRKCIVQCKRYKGTVGKSRLVEDLAKASQFTPDYFILATTGVINANTKDWLTAQTHFPFSIVLWERTDMDVLLERHQDLRSRFLGVPADEDFVLKHLSARHRALTSIGNWPLDSRSRKLISMSWDFAAKFKTALTNAHLLLAMVAMRPSILRDIIRDKTDASAKSLQVYLQQLAAHQAESQDGVLRVTRSYASVIDAAHELALSPCFQFVSEVLLCWCLLNYRSVSTLNVLRFLKLNSSDIRAYLSERHLSRAQRVHFLTLSLSRDTLEGTHNVDNTTTQLTTTGMYVPVEKLHFSDDTRSFLSSAGVTEIKIPLSPEDRIYRLPGISTEQIREIESVMDGSRE